MKMTSYWPDGETVRELEVTKVGESLHVELVSGPSLPGPANIDPNNPQDGWDDYILLNWNADQYRKSLGK